jgi:hypothetical protein
MLAYIRFIDLGLPIGHCTEWRSMPPLPSPVTATDPPSCPAIVAATCVLVPEADPSAPLG